MIPLAKEDDMNILTSEQLDLLKNLESMANSGTLTGMFSDIDAEVYHAGPGISSSQLKPYVARINGYDYETPNNYEALKFGRAYHAHILQPYIFTKMFSVGFTKVDHREFVTPTEMLMIKKMAAGFMANEQAKNFLNICQKEIVCYSVCPVTGILQKAMADLSFIDSDRLIIPDIKTTRTTKAWAFQKSCRDYLYRVSKAYYLKVFQEQQPTRLLAQSYLIACAKESSHDTKVFEVDEKSLSEGLKEVQEALQVIKREKEIGQAVWTEYDSKIKKIAI